ncbi:unnamed protein product [Polarella glacialis]|uniref:Glucosyltransferase 24 catalytic domain-containing protein n=1 Tax=Polarella glacialis TaxID=89957 RepID=A0A813JPZ9_POLGL|nr:unnamed protein product [Polarella glacialis]
MHLRPKDAGLPVLARLAATVDPLSEAASGLAPLARLVHEELNAEVCVALVPRPLDDYPLKRWRRSVFVSGRRGEAPAAVFARLKTRHTLTVALIAPPSWLVSAHSSEQDLDNIRAVDAVLKPDMALASHGGGRGGSENAATGLHLELQRTDGAGGVHLDSSSESSCGNADTRVMRNLGFWSMPACPGTFQLSLAPGASNDTFELVRGSPGSMEDVEVTSFTLANLPLKVRVRPGRQESDLASKTLGTAKRRSRWKRASTRHLNAVAAGNATAGGKVAEAQVEALPTIHVFSLASGHMYERLLSIMVMSVRNHTRAVFAVTAGLFVFTTLLPQLEADMEGVTFHLVSFKWPSWLNPQQEKQRLIWAYKILFLATGMFLIQVAGISFRFWESGYWQSHLGPSPYHISALFVVDLLEFRRQSVGDELRATYNQLTRDPGSLANLDQDLPNYAQHSIPIFSLPQEWLWCESWCSQPTKHLAKAIDLCQNPLTKEPKIAMARRVIPEWEGYHRRVLALQAGAVEAVQQVNSEAAAGRRQEL